MGGSVIPGTSTSNSLLPLSAAISDARCNGRPLALFLEDKSSAFDSITFSLLLFAMRRVGLPESFILFYRDNFLVGRSVHLITAFGPSAGFEPLQGVP